MNETDRSPSYRHPGQVFLSRYGLLEDEQVVFRYVEFLRQESGLTDVPPIDLSLIYRCFGMPTPLRAPLVEQQGILIDSDAGLILIKADDPIARQRFTEGHELMELFFDAHAQFAAIDRAWDEQRKEKLCDQGAAELLMPQSSFAPKLHELGMSLQRGRVLANLYQTSLLATLIRMIESASGACALIMWHSALRQRDTTTAKKLRVWWRTCSTGWNGGFIPKNKSIAFDSLIAQAYVSGQAQAGVEAIDFGWGASLYRVEAMPLQISSKACILSLLQRLDKGASLSLGE